MVDDQPYGGTCALRGCDPKKVLVGATDAADLHGRLAGYGIAGEARVDWPALMRFKRTFTDPVPRQRETAFEEAGVVTLHGSARFVAEDRLIVGEREIEARRVVLAVGAAPVPLGIPGEEHVRTSTDFLELDDLPARIAFVGGGYVAFEFAHVSQRAGAQAVVLGRGAPLAHFDSDLVERLVARTRELGGDVRTGTTVSRVERTADGFHVHTEGPGGTGVVAADLVVHAAGRAPNLGGLDLDRGNVRAEARAGIAVNEYLQSVTNPCVYATGDAARPAGSLPLTPVAAHEGAVVASNLLHGNAKRPDYRGVPSVVFTVPPLARVGLTQAEARERGIEVRVQLEETGTWYANRRVREPAGMTKTIVDTRTDRVLGAHLLGPHAEEVINLFALAVRHGLTATDLRHMIYAYPTHASDVVYML